jgi:two-component system, OmpR family, sensor kinase
VIASLRARLLAGLLALAAARLVLLAAIVYVEQRSFLLERADEQVRAATGAVGFALKEQDMPGGRPRDAGPAGGFRPGPTGSAATPVATSSAT